MAPMKLSEAIRLGSMLKPQGFGDIAEVDAAGELRATCAMGAATHALGLMRLCALDEEQIDSEVYAIYAAVLDPKQACPACSWRRAAYRIVHHLNDQHRWSREQIADWVETIERRADAEEAGTNALGATPAVST